MSVITRDFRRYDGEKIEVKIKGKIVAEYGDRVFWTLYGKMHIIRYCLQVKAFSGCIEASEEFGHCVLHCAECDGSL